MLVRGTSSQRRDDCTWNVTKANATGLDKKCPVVLFHWDSAGQSV